MQLACCNNERLVNPPLEPSVSIREVRFQSIADIPFDVNPA
jgi:hypothetical protein